MIFLFMKEMMILFFSVCLHKQLFHFVQKTIQRTLRFFQKFNHRVRNILYVLLDYSIIQYLLGLKIPITQSRHHMHGCRNISHGSCLISLFHKNPHGRVQYLLPADLRLLGYSGRLAFHLSIHLFF